MNDSTLDLLEQKAYDEAYSAFVVCDNFAARYELPVDYIYMEFVDPSVESLDTVLDTLDIHSLLTYNTTES